MRTTTVIVIVLATIAFALPPAGAEEADVTEDAGVILAQAPGDCLRVDPAHNPPLYMEPC